MCIRILQNEKKVISSQEIRFLMVGGVVINPQKDNPGKSWLSQKQWASIMDLA